MHSCFRLVPSRFSCLCDDKWEGLSEFALHQGKEGRKTGSEVCVKLTLILAMTDVRNINVVQNDSDTYKVKVYKVESKINIFPIVPDSVTCHPREQKPTGDM